MTSLKISDSILQHLYAHHYAATIESLSSGLKVDRASVIENVDALAKEGAVKRDGQSNVKITRLGVYYLESKMYVTRAQILASEMNQYALLRQAGDPGATDTIVADGQAVDLTSTQSAAIADLLGLIGNASGERRRHIRNHR